MHPTDLTRLQNPAVMRWPWPSGDNICDFVPGVTYQLYIDTVNTLTINVHVLILTKGAAVKGDMGAVNGPYCSRKSRKGKEIPLVSPYVSLRRGPLDMIIL